MKKNTNQKPRKIPERRCSGCGGTFPKKELIRVVRSPEGDVSLDFTGKKSGRGAYICSKSDCLKKARKTGRIARSLEVSISDELYEALEEEIALIERERAEEFE